MNEDGCWGHDLGDRLEPRFFGCPVTPKFQIRIIGIIDGLLLSNAENALEELLVTRQPFDSGALKVDHIIA